MMHFTNLLNAKKYNLQQELCQHKKKWILGFYEQLIGFQLSWNDK